MTVHEKFCVWLHGYLQACTDQDGICLDTDDAATIATRLKEVLEPKSDVLTTGDLMRRLKEDRDRNEKRAVPGIGGQIVGSPRQNELDMIQQTKVFDPQFHGSY